MIARLAGVICNPEAAYGLLVLYCGAFLLFDIFSSKKHEVRKKKLELRRPY